MACLHYLCTFILLLILQCSFPRLCAYERRNHENRNNVIASFYGKQLLLPILKFLLKDLLATGCGLELPILLFSN